MDVLLESINKMGGDESLDFHLVCDKPSFQKVMEVLLLLVRPEVQNTSDDSDHNDRTEDTDEVSQESIYEDVGGPQVRILCC